MNKDLEKLAKNLYKQMFNEELKIPVMFNSRFSNTYGQVTSYCQSNTYLVEKLEISTCLRNNMDLLIFILKHELIHVWLTSKKGIHGHGKEFRALANKMGIFTINPRTGKKSYLVTYTDKNEKPLKEV